MRSPTDGDYSLHAWCVHFIEVRVDEDFGTGSIHCALTPYWAERLRKNTVHSLQVSTRGAELHCELKGNRVEIAGQCVKYLEGWIEV